MRLSDQTETLTGTDWLGKKLIPESDLEVAILKDLIRLSFKQLPTPSAIQHSRDGTFVLRNGTAMLALEAFYVAGVERFFGKFQPIPVVATSEASSPLN